MERAFALCDGSQIKFEDLHVKEQIALPESASLTVSELSLPSYLERIEKQAIKEALAKKSKTKLQQQNYLV